MIKITGFLNFNGLACNVTCYYSC